MINIYYSRRNKFKLCYYYNRDESNFVGDLSRWVLEHTPSGQFYANEINPLQIRQEQLAGVMNYDKNVITLETMDNVNDIKVGSIVSYLGHAWMVDNLTETVNNKSQQFNTGDRITYISLRR